MVQKWILIDKLPDGLFKVIGEITVAAGQLEYVLMLSYKRASGKGMAVGMHKAEELLTVKNLFKELKKDFKKQIPDAAANRELGEILDTVWKVYQKRHTVVHAVFVETADGKLARFYSDKPNVRVKAIDYGVELEKLSTLRDNLRNARDCLNSFTKRWLLGKRAARVRRDVRKSKAPSHKPLLTSIRLDKLDRESVLSWEKKYWKHIDPNDAGRERQFEREFRDARRKGYLTKTLFEDVARWKSRQRLDLIRANSPQTVKRCSRMAFKARNRGDAVLTLKQLDGVALRRAVALLHWMRPREFPMIDVRVVEMVGWSNPKDWEDLDYYERFANYLEQPARRLGVNFRTLDRALWAMHKASGAVLSP